MAHRFLGAGSLPLAWNPGIRKEWGDRSNIPPSHASRLQWGHGRDRRGCGSAFQDEAPARSLRNEKNSTPSRRRRAIIDGLTTISETISAIFGARK